MKKKIFLVSIVLVLILILVSFTSVVGYNSIESDKKFSPLFNIRTSRAVDKDSKDFSCEYVGKGEESVLSIPNRDDKKALLQKILVKIQDIDYKELKRMSYLNLINDELIEHPIIQHILSGDFTLEANDYTSSPYYTLCNWFPGCIPYMLLMIPLIAFYIMYFIFIVVFQPTALMTCSCT